MKGRVRLLLAAVAAVLLLPGTATAAGGEPVWVQHLDVPAPEIYSFPEGNATDPTTGNVYVAGYRCSRASCGYRSSALTAAYSPSGDALWQTRYDGAGLIDLAASIAVDPTTGTVVVAGSSSEPGGVQRLLTIAYDSGGRQLWLARHQAEFGSEGIEVAIDGRRGQVYVVARTGYGGPSLDYLTVAYDVVGTELWAATYDGLPGAQSAYDQVEAVAVDVNRGTVLVGGTSGSDLTGDYDAAAVAYSPTGQELWVAQYDGAAGRDDTLQDVEVDPSSGTYYVAGSTDSATRTDLLTVAYDTAGNLLWSDTYDGPAHDFESALAIGVNSRTGQVYVAGDSANRRNNDYDWVTLAYAASGARLWANRYGGPRNDYPDVVTVNRSTGAVYVAGLQDNDATVITYSAAGTQVGTTQYADATGEVEGFVLDVPRRQAYLTFSSYGPDGERPVGMTTVAYGVG